MHLAFQKTDKEKLKVPRELRTSFRIFPSQEGEGYTILYPSSFRTKYGNFEVLGHNIPEEIAALVLQGIQHFQRNPDQLRNLYAASANGMNHAWTLMGAEPCGGRYTDWWRDLVPGRRVREERQGIPVHELLRD